MKPTRKPTRRSCPDFLSKLVLILSKENPDIIRWESGRIYLKDPMRLMSQILKKYFRHANYNSFKRQLNYFGFRKIDGKGKFEPCVYHNEELEGKDVEEITKIKRKTSNGPSYLLFPYNELKISPPNLYSQFSMKSHLFKNNPPGTSIVSLTSESANHGHMESSRIRKLSEGKVKTVLYPAPSPSPLTLLKYERASELAPHSTIKHTNIEPSQTFGLQCLIQACEMHLAQSNAPYISSRST